MADERLAFMVAGVAHSGAETMFERICAAPAVCAPAQRALHFFDDETQDWARPDYGRYHARFGASTGRMRGEATADYLYWPRALDRIAAYSPKLKLIVMLRDPALRAWNHWRAARAEGAEAEAFAWCIRTGRQRLFAAQPWGVHRIYSYVERGFYGEQIGRLYDLFPREQLLVLRTDGPAANAELTLARALNFLEVAPGPMALSPDAPPPLPPDAISLADEDLVYLRGVYARDQDRLAALTGFRFD
jgi:hypothetical protein